MPDGYMGGKTIKENGVVRAFKEWKIKHGHNILTCTESQAIHLMNKCGYKVRVNAGATTIISKGGR